jgi:hypothetical protein
MSYPRRRSLHQAVIKLMLLSLLSSIFSGVVPPPLVRAVLPPAAADVAEALLPQPQVALAAAGTITVNVYEDFNANGVKDTAFGQTDVGLQEITATAYCADGTAVPATTDASGVATITHSCADPAAPLDPAQAHVRVEVTWNTALTPFAGLQPAPQASSGSQANGTTVQFVGGGAQTVNVGLLRPSDYVGTIPTLVASAQWAGTYNNDISAQPALYGTAWEASPTTVNTVDTRINTGSIWGVAYSRSRKIIFSAASVKRHAGLGPGGIGAIYRTPATGGASTLFTSVSGVGSIPDDTIRGLGDEVVTQADQEVFTKVGKAGIGDIDISDDETALWYVNLFDGQLYRLPIGTPPALTAGTATSVGMGNATCTNGTLRPWAVKYYGDKVYVGAVCDAGSDTPTAGTPNSNLNARVFAYDPATSSWSIVLGPIPLDFPRGKIIDGVLGINGANTNLWYPWTNTYVDIEPAAARHWVYPQPILADLEFDVNGVLLLGLKDRHGDQSGTDNLRPDGSGTGESGWAAGTVLKACWNYTTNQYVLESNGACGVIGDANRTVNGNGATSNGQGPGGDEFFYQDYEAPAEFNQETGSAGLALLPGSGLIATSAHDVGGAENHGIEWYSQTDGTNPRGRELYPVCDFSNCRGNFYKSDGLGDMELLGNAPPLEIGNRVWRDSNNNGIQDPGESPLAGVVVELYQGGVKVGEATTNSAGEYYFGGASNRNMLTSPTVNTLTIPVAASSDDAAQTTSGGGTGTVSTNATGLNLPYNTTPALNLVGMRFNGLSIPQGATIASANIQFTANAAGATAVNLTINGEAADNAATYANTTNNISSRTTTGASVNWIPGAWTAGATTNATTPDLKSIVQEIVNRAGWSSGNSMAFVISNNTTTSPNRRIARAFDNSSGGAPVLTVAYNQPFSLQPNTAYEVRIPNASGGSQQAALSGLSLTTQNADGVTSNDPMLDLRDSDGALSGVNAVIAYTTGSAGVNNHTLDFGFTPPLPTTLQIVKNTIGGNGSFGFTSPNATLDAIHLTTVGGTASSAVYTLSPGSYVISEDALVGWSLTSLSCTGDTDNGSLVNLASRAVTIDLDAGENIVCTFSNTAQTSSVTPSNVLTLTKTVVGNPGSVTSYAVTVNGPNGYVNNPTITPGTPVVLTGLAGGVYTVTETSPGAGWVTTYTVSSAPGTVLSGRAVVDLTNPSSIAPFAAVPVSGRVYRDFNSDGQITANGTITDTGVANVRVTAYGASGAACGSTTSDSTGNYTFTPSCAGPWRLVFSDLPAGYEPTTHGMQNGTSVQFINTAAGASNVNLGINVPCDYCQGNPLIVGSRHIFSDTSVYPGVAALLAYPYNTTQADNTPRPAEFSSSTYGQVGNTWGRTYKRDTKELFSAAIAQRGLALGSGGAGGIYKTVGMTTAGAKTTTLFATIPNVGTVGTNAARQLQNLPRVLDTAMYTLTGKVGLGGLTISDDGTTLYVMNLNDKSVYPVNASSGAVGTSIAVTDPGCGASPYRPWALKQYRGDLYAGVVCEDISNAYVVKLAGPGFATQTVVNTTPLNYTHDQVAAQGTCNTDITTWKAWSDGPLPPICDPGLSIAAWPTPLLAGLEFADNGDLLLSFGDRFAMQMGPGLPSPFAASADATPVGAYNAGDILLATKSGSGWSAGSPTLYETADNFIWPTVKHGQISLGGLAVLPGSLEFNLGVYDPINDLNRSFDQFETGGVRTIGQTSGSLNRQYQLYGQADTPNVFGSKAQGLGDLELLCDAAPIEIGNRVWNDLNGDGIQDAGEPGLPGITVSRQGPTNTVTAVTDANGLYYFGNLKPYTAYTLTMSVPAGYNLTAANQAALSGASVQSNHAISDTIDSDAALVGGLATIYYSTGGPGQNNHGLDFGFTQPVKRQVDIFNTAPILYDWGDLPDGNANGSPSYNTLNANGGPSHRIVPGLRIGPNIDGENDGQPSADATGDDTTSTPDDEDGVTLPNLVAGQPATVTVSVTNTTGQAATLYGFIDFNGDGNFDDAEERVTVTVPNNTVGVVNLRFNVPATADTTQALGARFRLSTAPDLGPDGPAPDGEVEDYLTAISRISLGNLVWYDLNNDGLYDPAGADNTPGNGDDELPIEGVRVELFYDADGNGLIEGAEQTPVAVDVTDANGLYLFDQLTDADGEPLEVPTALTPGQYVVGIAVSNFSVGGPLYGFYSSLVTANSDGSRSETAPPDPDVGAMPAIDNDDNGQHQSSGFYSGGVLSLPVTLTPGSEPLGENPDNDPITPDANENLTVDFGFYSVAVGNQVWRDDDNSGTRNGSEPGIDGVPMRLYAADGTTLISSTVTSAGGFYRFANLPAGQYIIEVATTAPALAGLASSTGPGQSDDPSNNIDDDDNGTVVTTTTVRSTVFSLTPGTPGAQQNNILNDPVGVTENPTIDFGFTPVYSLGNRVWVDDGAGGGGANDGLQDGNELGRGGVIVRLLDSSGNIATDLNGAQLADQTTDANGYYRFDNLLAGDYVVEIIADNFATGGALNGYSSSSGAGEEAAPNANGDRNDNGVNLVADAIRSGAVTLGPLSVSEPITETDIANPNPPGEAPNAQSNLTVDFGFVQLLSVGNLVWFDTNNNGRFDSGVEQPIAGVRVQLFRDNGNGVFEPGVDSEVNTGPDGVLGTGDDAPGGMLTDANGNYLFSGLTNGTYFVVLPESNFTTGGVLRGYHNSTLTVAGDSDLNEQDHGNVVGVLGQTGGYVASSGVTLVGGSEPINDGDDNPNSNLTIDFGFYTMSLGNLVWVDTNNNGLRDGAEVGLAQVPVELLNSAGTVVMTTTTDASGIYTFTGLMSGTYSVRITPPVGYASSTGTRVSSSGPYEPAPDPNNNTDNDDNGTAIIPPVGGTGGGSITSLPIVLTPGAEPTVNHPTGSTSNPTLDFGLFQPLSVGNLVWHDRNNNGRYDPNGADNLPGTADDELGIDGVTVRLLTANGQTVLSTTVTSGGGLYLFRNVPAGNHVIEVDIPAGYVSSTGVNGSASGPYEPALDPDLNNDPDNDDNGTTYSATTVRSLAVTLQVGTEPIGENPDNDLVTPDANENLTVDFGFYQPLSLGNRVWYDRNNDGLHDEDGLDNVLGNGDDEPGIANVLVQLFFDANNNGVLDGSEATTPVASMLTDANGHYLFDRLIAGNYQVVLASSNFLPNAPLANYTSSTGVNAAAGPYEPAPDPDDNAADRDDNGSLSGALGSSGVISSGLVALSLDSEPTGESDLGTLGSGLAADDNSNLTVDFGVIPLLSLGDLVWRDNNNSGVVDDNEVGIPGVTVQLFLDTNGNGVFDPGVDSEVNVGPDGVLGTADDAPGGMTTDANGIYLFTRLPPGEYIVVLPASNFVAGGPLFEHFSSTGGGSEPAPDVDDDPANDDDNGTTFGTLGTDGYVASWAVTLTPHSEPTDDGDTDDNSNRSVDFGLFQRASLGDRVWYDGNLNGLQDDGEQGVDGVTVTLYDAAGTPLSTTLTSNGGIYGFTNLLPGQYYVVFSDLPAGHVFTLQDASGATGDDGNDTDSDADPVTGRTILVTLTGNEHDPSWDAGIYQLAGLGNYVWEDLDRNGQQDPNEPPVPGVTVHLLDSTGTPISTTVTGPAGDYFFGNLIPGTYSVQFVPPEGYQFTVPNAVTDTIDSDADPTPGSTFGQTPPVTLTPGETNPTLDAGLWRPASLGDYVWADNDLDGVQDGGEPGVANVTVNLYDGEDNLVDSTVTNADGFYEFTDLVPGVPYQVEFVLPPGYSFSPQDNSPNDDTNDSDADRATGYTAFVTLESGEHNPTIDAGVYALASIGDRVWLDRNGNGLQDDGEPGIPDVTVTLYTSDEAFVGSTSTDVNGRYIFTDLVPGGYYVVFTSPPGYVISPQDASGATGDDGNDTDSDADPQTGRTVVATLTPGEYDPSWDLGLYQPVTVGDYVWVDTDADGVQEAGEVGVPGVTVTLYNNTTGQPVLIDGQPFTEVTDADGLYLFTGLPPGDYYVVFDLTTLPAGYRVTTPNVGDDTTDSDANPATGRTAATGFLPSGSANLTLDMGVYLPVRVGDHVWIDEDYDGQQDITEPGVPGVTVTLYDNATGQPVLVNGQPLTDVTDADGLYFFENLPPGEYYVVFDLTTLPAGYVPTQANVGSDTSDSDADPTTGQTAATNFLPSGTENRTLDMGIFRPVTVGDYVWFDQDYDGQQDVGEPGVPGIKVTIYDAETNQPVLVNGKSLTATTDATGRYLFDNLLPGSYYVVFDLTSLPAGYQVTKQDVGPNDTDSDADPVTGRTAATTFLPSGTVNLTLDMGLYRRMSLGNRVWQDTNNNGRIDPNETGISDVVLSLRYADGSPFLVNGKPYTTTTDARGYYLFDNLPPGEYIVRVDPINFAPNGPLSFLNSSIPTELNPNADVDNNDNGIDVANPAISGVSSGVVDLTYGREPMTESDLGPRRSGNATNEDSNLTVDFGFSAPTALGDEREPRSGRNQRLFLPVVRR